MTSQFTKQQKSPTFSKGDNNRRKACISLQHEPFCSDLCGSVVNMTGSFTIEHLRFSQSMRESYSPLVDFLLVLRISPQNQADFPRNFLGKIIDTEMLDV